MHILSFSTVNFTAFVPVSRDASARRPGLLLSSALV